MKTRIFKKTISFSLSASFLILNSCQPPIGNQVANRSQNQNSLKESNENSNHLKNDVDGFDSFFKKEQFQVSAQITENNGLIRIYGGPQDITDYQGDLKFNSSSALFESTEFSSKKPDIYYDIEISGATALPKFVSLSIGNIISPNPDISTYTNNPGVGFYMFSQFFPREEYFTLNKIEQNTQLLTPPSQPYDPLNIWSCLGRYGSESLEYIPNEQLGYINTQFHADVKNYQDITPVFSRFEITGGKYTIERIRKLVGGKEKEFFKISITDIQSGKSSGKHDGSAMWNCLSNVGSFSGSISFLIPIPDLALSITPVVLKGEDDNKQSRIKVIDVDGIKPWTLKITPITGSSVGSDNVDEACLPPNGGPIYVKQGVGNMDFNWPEIPHTLGNGVYDVELHYDDAQPGEGQFATVKVDYPIEVKLSENAQSPFDPRNGESTSFDVKAPGCPEWALRVTGTHDSVFANVPGSACTWQDFFGQTANQSDLYWNGFCTADNPLQPNPQNPFPPSPLQLITPGSYDVNLYFKQKDDTYSTTSAASTSVTVGSGFYCPPGQTCASPSPGGGPGSSPSPGASPGTGPSGSPSSGPSGSPGSWPSSNPSASPSPSPSPRPPRPPSMPRRPRPERKPKFNQLGCTNLANPSTRALRIVGEIDGLIGRLKDDTTNASKQASLGGEFGIASVNSEPFNFVDAYWKIRDDMDYLQESLSGLRDLIISKKGSMPNEPVFEADYTNTLQNLNTQFASLPATGSLLQKSEILYAETVISLRLVEQELARLQEPHSKKSPVRPQLREIEQLVRVHTRAIAEKVDEWFELSENQKQRWEAEKNTSIAILDRVISELSGGSNGGFQTQSTGGLPTETTSVLIPAAQNIRAVLLSHPTVGTTPMAFQAVTVAEAAIVAAAPYSLTPHGAATIVALTAVLGVALYWRDVHQQAICEEQFTKSYGNNSIDNLNALFVLAAAETVDRLTRTTNCDATRSSDSQIKQRGLDALKNTQEFTKNRFGANGNYTDYLKNLTRLVKADNGEDEANKSMIKSKMDAMANSLNSFMSPNGQLLTQAKKLQDDCEADASKCVYDARDEFLETGRPAQLDMNDPLCFVYRAGEVIPNNFTPSTIDYEADPSNPNNLLGGLSTSGSYTSISNLPAANRGVQKISVPLLAAKGLYAYYNRSGDDHVSLVPENPWTPPNHSPRMLTWAFMSPQNGTAFKNWANSYRGSNLPGFVLPPGKVYALPKWAKKTSWVPSQSRKEAIVEWKDIFTSGLLDNTWKNIMWVNNSASYPFLDEVLSPYTKAVGSSVVMTLPKKKKNDAK